MILTLAASFVLAQSTAPVLPAGASRQFQKDVLEVESLLEKKDFTGAEARLRVMPTSKITFNWDDRAVPPADRDLYGKAREAALMSFRRIMRNLSFESSPDAPITIRFVDLNPNRPDTDLPMGMDVAWNEGRLVGTIGMRRGKPIQSTGVNDIANDFGRAIATYLGIGDLPVSGTVLIPSDQSTARLLALPLQSAEVVNGNLKALDQLRAAARDKVSISPSTSQFYSSTKDTELGEVMQGTTKDFSINVENHGKAPLALWVKPECGCMTLEEPQTLAAGEVKDIRVTFDPVEFRGIVHKKIFVVSNDPNQPLTIFNLTVNVTMAYSFIAPSGDAIVVGDKPTKTTVYLVCNDDVPFNVLKMGINGVRGDLDFEPWEGTLADPAKGEPARERKGFKISVSISPNLPPGRSPSSLIVVTDSPKFHAAVWSITVQKGIVAVPDELYMGDLDGPKTSKLLVSRPGKKFKILKVTTSTQSLKVAVKPGQTPDEFVLEVSYDGKGPSGEYAPTITVTTDDPKQPVVTIPVTGTIP